MKFFFVLPVFNDQVSLLNLIQDIKNILDKGDNKLEFIIIDDASTKKFKDLKDLKVTHYIKLKSNQGNQKSIYVGIKYLNDLNVNYDYLIIMDSDGEDNPHDISKLVEKCKNHNNDRIIFASRLKRNEGLIYKFFYFFYKLIFRLLTGQKFDFGNFSCIPKKLLNNILNLQTISFHYSASVLKSKIPHSTIFCDKGKRFDGNTHTKLTSIILHALKSLSIYYKEILVKFLILSAGGAILSTLSIIFIFLNFFFPSFVLIVWSSEMILGLSIVTIIFLSMFFVCLLILLNKNIYKNNFKDLKNYKSLIDKVENLSI